MIQLRLARGDGVVIVAHPDDETIWSGGTILKFKNVNWTIIALSRGDDPDRAPKFKRVCRFYGARAIISDLEDEGVMNIGESVPEIERRLTRALGGARRVDYLVTHAYNGEYGHPRHKGVHRAVTNLVRARRIIPKQLYTFAYHLDERKGFAKPDAQSDLSLMLPENIFYAKRRVISDLYGFKKNSFEYKSCARRESFNQERI